ncbi:MAG: hypothetical protein LAO03_03690 [Acidobacteriia bacterium]|nr:hypothetical protein [Terriglobia bacterium]
MRTARSFSLAGVLLAGLVLALSGCGGGGTTSQPAVINNTGVADCADGTVASYMGTSCSQAPAVMQWTAYTCTSTPASLCTALGSNGSNIKMKMDPNGKHTILVVGSGLWNVTAGQSVDIAIQGSVYGATTNNNWPHFGNLLGQTGDGTEDNKTTVSCSTNCVALQGVSDIPCSNTSPVAYCIDQITIDPYLSETAKFKPASSSQPYLFTIEIKLDGGISGTATVQSVGIHLS